MKKIFTLIAMAMMTIASQAQDLQFCYEDGTAIPSGTTVVVSTPDQELFEEDGTRMYESGIYIKNTTAGTVNSTLSFEVTEFQEESELSVCLGTQCNMYSKVGTYNISNVNLAAGSISSMQCHWAPAYDYDLDDYIYGSCTGTYTLKSGSTTCSTITVQFVYADPASVESTTGTAKVVKTYDVMGRQTIGAKGIVLQKMSDGSVRKVLK